jgi:hypothetical protein
MEMDPTNLDSLKELAPNEDTSSKYGGWWKSFVGRSGINSSREPTEADFYTELKWRRNDNGDGKGMKGSSLWTLYSGINLAYMSIYGVKLDVSTDFIYF